MVLSDEKKMEYIKRLLMSRLHILINNGFYGLLLMHMKFSLDESCETASTDGVRIYFSPSFLDELDDDELDFVMMHEILHIVLQHCLRRGDRDNELFNIACDIVVNSNIYLSENKNIKAITLRKYGEAMHQTPEGKEGYEYTAEEVYSMLHNSIGDSNLGKDNKAGDSSGTEDGKTGASTWDDHTKWGSIEDDNSLRDIWIKRFKDACESIEVRDPSNKMGLLPLFAERLLKELRNPQVDWRSILNDFVQEEVVDYSFSPPDRRYDGGDFYLPDFNDKENAVKNILFMIDTSASMSDDMVTAAYSEIKGAIDEYNGNLQGWLGFFDASVLEPVPFSDENEFRLIKPAGGGGTNFHIIFEYIKRHMQDELPASIIILTDGYAKFPKEEYAMGIPVLWLLNNDKVEPPWGRVARIIIN